MLENIFAERSPIFKFAGLTSGHAPPIACLDHHLPAASGCYLPNFYERFFPINASETLELRQGTGFVRQFSRSSNPKLQNQKEPGDNNGVFEYMVASNIRTTTPGDPEGRARYIRREWREGEQSRRQTLLELDFGQVDCRFSYNGSVWQPVNDPTCRLTSLRW